LPVLPTAGHEATPARLVTPKVLLLMLLLDILCPIPVVVITPARRGRACVQVIYRRPAGQGLVLDPRRARGEVVHRPVVGRERRLQRLQRLGWGEEDG